jgi:hypothetical protein
LSAGRTARGASGNGGKGKVPEIAVTQFFPTEKTIAPGFEAED